LIDSYFKLAENQTSVKQEMLDGLMTFVTMAYIIVVNPQILAQAGTVALCRTHGPAMERRW
jgi:adenine/guanine/hypoxanthine permease